jgi:hypothetical protein
LKTRRASGHAEINPSDGTSKANRWPRETSSGKENYMLWTVAVILIVLWALGLVSSYTLGGFIHILLVVAVIVVLLNVIRGRRVF